MSVSEQAVVLREEMRLLVRKLGILERGEASCCKITISQCHTIVEIGRAGKLSINDLADLLNLDKSTVSRSVDNLVNQGAINRETDPADRRYVMLNLTEQGEKVYREVEERMEAYFLEVIGKIPAEKREQIVDSLHYLIAAINGSGYC